MTFGAAIKQFQNCTSSYLVRKVIYITDWWFRCHCNCLYGTWQCLFILYVHHYSDTYLFFHRTVCSHLCHICHLIYRRSNTVLTVHVQQLLTDTNSNLLQVTCSDHIYYLCTGNLHTGCATYDIMVHDAISTNHVRGYNWPWKHIIDQRNIMLMYLLYIMYTTNANAQWTIFQHSTMRNILFLLSYWNTFFSKINLTPPCFIHKLSRYCD